MAIVTDFIQANEITDLAVELVLERSVWQNVMRVSTKRGSSVKMPKYNGVTARTYTGGVLEVDKGGSTNVTINIDQSHYVNERTEPVEDMNEAQSQLSQILDSIANAFVKIKETHAFSTMYTDAAITDAANLGATVTPITVATEADVIALMKAVRILLNKNKISLAEAFLVLPPELEAIVYDTVISRDTNNSMQLKTGQIGTVGGLEIYQSNFLPAPAAGERAFLAGSKKAFDFIYNYDEFETGDGGITYPGKFYRQITNFGAGANNADLLIKGVVAEA